MMCRQSVVLETLKKTGNRLGKCAVMLAEAQAEDYQRMDERMKNLEKEVHGLRQDFNTKTSEMDSKIDQVLKMLQQEKEKPSFLTVLKAVMSNRIFLYLLITLIAGAFGVSVAELGTFIFKQGM